MDIKEEVIDLTDTRLVFNGISQNKKYQFDMELFGEVNKEESKWRKTGFHLLFVIQKKEPSAFWPRLTKTKEKNQFIQIDWSKWVN